jgi:vacuolar-type H+-ATPase subunit C/Vma6
MVTGLEMDENAASNLIKTHGVCEIAERACGYGYHVRTYILDFDRGRSIKVEDVHSWLMLSLLR